MNTYSKCIFESPNPCFIWLAFRLGVRQLVVAKIQAQGDLVQGEVWS